MGGITDRNMKSRAVRDTLVGVIVVLAAIAFVILYRYAANRRIEREEADIDSGRIVTTNSGEMEIQTRFYSLHCPDSWKDHIAVQCFPAKEKFLGDYSDRELLGNDIDPENYTLRIQCLGKHGRHLVADLEMAGFLEDYQRYKYWTYAGDIRMDRREGQYNTYLLLLYPEETEDMKSDPVYQQIRRELPDVVYDLVLLFVETKSGCRGSWINLEGILRGKVAAVRGRKRKGSCGKGRIEERWIWKSFAEHQTLWWNWKQPARSV